MPTRRRRGRGPRRARKDRGLADLLGARRLKMTAALLVVACTRQLEWALLASSRRGGGCLPCGSKEMTDAWCSLHMDRCTCLRHNMRIGKSVEEVMVFTLPHVGVPLLRVRLASASQRPHSGSRLLVSRTTWPKMQRDSRKRSRLWKRSSSRNRLCSRPCVRCLRPCVTSGSNQGMPTGTRNWTISSACQQTKLPRLDLGLGMRSIQSRRHAGHQRPGLSTGLPWRWAHGAGLPRDE